MSLLVVRWGVAVMCVMLPVVCRVHAAAAAVVAVVEKDACVRCMVV